MILNIGTGETAPRCSIIMPTFNRGHIVTRAIRSVIAQAFGDWELLVIDDGSKDETFAAIRDVVRSDTRIRYHFASNRGLAMARNLGIQMSRGEYLTFLDSDDEYTPEHLALRAQYVAEQASVALLHGGVEVIGQQFVADTCDPTKLVAIADCVVGGTFFVRRDLVERLGGFRDVAYGDDNDFYSRAEANGEVIAHVNYPTYRYHRTQEDSLCAIVEREGVAGIAAYRANGTHRSDTSTTRSVDANVRSIAESFPIANCTEKGPTSPTSSVAR